MTATVYRVTAWSAGLKTPVYKMRFDSYYLAMEALVRWDDGEHQVSFETIWKKG